ncbi:hypothetical protein LCGC14_0321050 [marine sediment metagenome]|uniref:Pilus assembly protein PilO n=1 Tax=marine sediment metagenome TaxID=412755 RepID=A0A0F9WRB1_9ZZZZ|nr:hypothetical protein [Phycisphaerae bacterium]HDZ43129.1 hypothetical protein [Phycisphaerae bacterium]
MLDRFGKNTWLMLAPMAAIVIGAVVLVFMPQSGQLKRLESQITAQRYKLRAESEQASVVPELVRQVEGMKQRYKDFDHRLPKRTELGGFLRDIARHLDEHDLSNQSIEPGNPTRSELFHTLPITMRFRGSYMNIARFLHGLAEMERLSRVEMLQIARDNGQEDLEAEMQINIYFTER